MEQKQRHGCVTAWIILMIIFNSLLSVLCIFGVEFVSKNLPNDVSDNMLAILAMLGFLNVVFAILLLLWKKIGFWGFVVTSLAALIINLNIGLSITQSLLGLVGIILLYAVLQIKVDNVSAWQNLE